MKNIEGDLVLKKLNKEKKSIKKHEKNQKKFEKPNLITLFE